MKTPLVSIIIPAFNSQNTIQETIDSVVSQTYINWEAIVIDDYSEDETFSVVEAISKKDQRVKIYKRNAEKKGGSVCRNAGISKSNGEYLIFLDSDDLLSNDCLFRRVEFMQQNLHLDFAVFQMQGFNENGMIPNKLMTAYKTDYLESYLSHNLPWAITCPIFRKEILLKHGGFDERFPRLQDPEFFTRLLLDKNISFEVLYYSKPDCFYRIVGNLKYNVMLDKMLQGFFLYITIFYDLTKNEANKQYYQRALISCFFASIRTYVKLISKDNRALVIPILKEIVRFAWQNLLSFRDKLKMCIILPLIITSITNLRAFKIIMLRSR